MEQGTKRYTIFHTPVLSFFSKPFYQDVAWHWKGTNLLYLFLLLALTWLPLLLQWQRKLSRSITEHAAPFVDQVPPTTIRDGKLSIDAPEPYFIKDPDSGRPLVVIDTTGEIASLDDTEAQVLVTETKLIVQNSQSQTQTNDLSQIPYFHLDKEKVAGWIDLVRRWFFIVAFPVLLVGSYVYRILQALVYGLVALAFASGMRAKLTYDDTLRLAVVAVTPVIVLDTVKLLTGIDIPMWWPICLGIAMLYLFLGVKFAAERPPEPEEYEIVEPATLV